MKAWTIGLLLSACAGAAGAQEAAAIGADPAGVTVAETMAWLKASGFEAEQDVNAVGAPVVYSSVGKTKFDVLFFDCEAERCGSLQFAAAFKLKTAPDAELINRWNRGNRYLKAYLGNDGTAHVQYDINVNVGRTPAMLSDDFGVWTANMPKFPTFIGF